MHPGNVCSLNGGNRLTRVAANTTRSKDTPDCNYSKAVGNVLNTSATAS